MKLLPGPSSGGPVSIFQDEGASTANTGTLESRSASMTLGNGSRTSPEKENPKIESTTWSVEAIADVKSLVKGISRSFNCCVRR